MGTWGTGIFDADIAGDVRDAFEDELMDSADVATATKRVLARFASALDDSDEGPVIYLALAALQLEHGALLPDIRQRAIEVIDNEEGLDAWEESGPARLLERKKALADFRERINQSLRHST